MASSTLGPTGYCETAHIEEIDITGAGARTYAGAHPATGQVWHYAGDGIAIPPASTVRGAHVTMSVMADRDRSRSRGDDKERASQQSAGGPSPSEVLPTLDEHHLSVLRRVGHEWSRVTGDPEMWRSALPVDPNLGSYPATADVQPARFGRFVRIPTLSGQPTAVETTGEAQAPPSPLGRVGYHLRRLLLGAPLKSTAIARERMRKLVALPVLSADALSSVAYGPEAMLAVLVLAGSAGLSYSLPLAAAIAFLMLAVGVSYRQTIRAYPHGGGSYIVASDNLGRVPGLVAAAGLMTDYILTVAVSIASGLAAITSAVPSLAPDAVPIGLGVIAVLLAGNLRGVRQAGVLFAAPTYAFIVAIFALVAVGLYNAAGHGFQPTPPPPLPAMEGLSLLLVLRAFASGSTAMTGIEAISNAVPAFKPVEWRNARTTLTWMIGLLITLFAGTITIVHLDGVVPTAASTQASCTASRRPPRRRSCCSRRTPPTTTSPAYCSCWPATATHRGSFFGWAIAWPSATGSSCSRLRRPRSS